MQLSEYFMVPVFKNSIQEDQGEIINLFKHSEDDHNNINYERWT